ncbi:hypothetical protein JCM8202_005994 [Rhodotorula sphaerocarpa]
MSNSDKFDQDAAIVNEEPEVQGVLADGEAGDDSVALNPADAKDEFEKDEFDGLKKENIIEGERQHRTGGYADAENKADAMIEGAVNANDGTSRVA